MTLLSVVRVGKGSARHTVPCRVGAPRQGSCSRSDSVSSGCAS